MLSLSSCWNSHRHQDGEGIVLEAQQLGFQYIELSHGLKVTHLPGVLAAVNRGEIRVSSVHNFCPSPVEITMDAPDAYEFTSPRTAERDRAMNLTERTIEMAARLGSQRVVIHLGSVRMKSYTAELEAMTQAGKIYSRDYIKTKLELVTQRTKASQVYLDRAKSAIDELLPTCEAYKVALGVETRSHYEQVPTEAEMVHLMQHYADCPWVGFWHDFGHVQRKANLGLLNHEELLRTIAPRLLGCHVHDVAWPERDHRIPFTGGQVDFDKLLPLVPKDIPLVWELSPSQKRQHVQERLAEWRTRFGS